jgi:hypothetical protein
MEALRGELDAAIFRGLRSLPQISYAVGRIGSNDTFGPFSQQQDNKICPPLIGLVGYNE